MMGRGGSDNYKINIGDTIQTDDDGNVVVGDYGVAGDVINEIVVVLKIKQLYNFILSTVN